MSRQKGRVEKERTADIHEIRYGRLGTSKDRVNLAMFLIVALRQKDETGQRGLDRICEALDSAQSKPPFCLSLVPVKTLLKLIVEVVEKGDGDELRKLADLLEVSKKTNDPVGYVLLHLEVPMTAKEIHSLASKQFRSFKGDIKTVYRRAKELGLRHLVEDAPKGAPKGRRKKPHRAPR